MKAKWLWSSWALLALVAVIALQVLFIMFTLVFLYPKFQKIRHDGLIDAAEFGNDALWMVSFLDGLNEVAGHYTTFMLLAAVAVWGLFEWRVKSENKPFIRLSALGTVAVGLMMVVILMAGSLVILFTLSMPSVLLYRPWAVEQVTTIDASIGKLEQALPKKDWETMEVEADQASKVLKRLSSRPAANSLWFGKEPMRLTMEELREHIIAASEYLRDAQNAIHNKDADGVEKALQRFRKSFGPVREAAKRMLR